MALRFTAQAAQSVLTRGLYDATLDKVEVRTGPNGDYLMWIFIVEADGSTVMIGRPSSTKFTGGSKARLFVDALLGRHINDEEEIDLEALYGASCQVLITVVKLDGSGTPVNRIESVLAFPSESQNGDNGDVPF